MIKALRKNLELIFWATAILGLAVAQPEAQTHFTLCVFKLAGISWCPGCGIGHAMMYLLHGQVRASLQHHWLGIPAIGAIFYRMYGLSFKQMFTFKKLKLYMHGL